MYNLEFFSRDTIMRYGKSNQMSKSIEELSELTTELARGCQCDYTNRDEVLTEVADVRIMLETIASVYNIDKSEIHAEMDRKIKRETEKWELNQH